MLEDHSARLMREQLREKQLTPLTVEAIHIEKKPSDNSIKKARPFSRGKMSPADLALITRQMATLFQAGLPVDEVLTALSKQTEKQMVKQILLGVRSKVLEGYGLAAAMDNFPNAFSALYRTTVSAGERTGKLGKVLDQLAEYTEKQHAIRQKIKQALIYPVMMISVSMSIVVFLLLYVVPKIVAVFTQTNQTLPMPTQNFNWD